MKYTFENSEKCDRCGDTTSEKCGLKFGGQENTYCLKCKDLSLDAINLKALLKSGTTLTDEAIDDIIKKEIN